MGADLLLVDGDPIANIKLLVIGYNNHYKPEISTDLVVRF